MDRSESAIREATKYKWLVSNGIEPGKLSREARAYLGGKEVDWQIEALPETRLEKLEKVQEKWREAPPAEKPALERTIAKYQVELKYEDMDKEYVIDAYDLSRNDLGREMNRIERTEGRAAAEDYFEEVLAYADTLFENGALDTKSHKYRNNKGQVNLPSTWAHKSESETTNTKGLSPTRGIDRLLSSQSGRISQIDARKLFSGSYFR